MDIIKRAKELNFPLGEYVIVGGGILEALGLRDTNDVDVVVMPKLLEKLRESGKCIAVIHRKDDNDDKLVIVPENAREMSNEKILKAVNFKEKWFDSVVIR